MKSTNSLSEALRLIRVYNDMTQAQLADKLDISKSYLSELEAGKKEPTIALITRYSEVFKINPSVILFFSEKLTKKKSLHGLALQKMFLNTLNFFEKFNDQEKDQNL